MQDPALEAWLDWALFENYGRLPKELYVKAEPKK
jgi:hypothetical protein